MVVFSILLKNFVYIWHLIIGHVLFVTLKINKLSCYTPEIKN